jgi:hypothetical protein
MCDGTADVAIEVGQNELFVGHFVIAEMLQILQMSFRRTPESRVSQLRFWIPARACARPE